MLFTLGVKYISYTLKEHKDHGSSLWNDSVCDILSSNIQNYVVVYLQQCASN